MIRASFSALRRGFGPSLARRLLVAQCVLLVTLWTLLVAASFYSSHRENDMLPSDVVFQLALAIADAPHPSPETRHDVLAAFDRAIAKEYGDESDTPDFVPALVVRRDGAVIYQSRAGVPPPSETDGAITRVSIDGETWRMRTLRSASSEVSIAMPDLHILIVNFNSRGYYLLPLIVSLPLLVLPAWWSVRVALRPWRKVSEEIATRGVDDLRPLTVRPPHAELHPLVDGVDALLTRVRDSAERERNLIADAAHELRTPLAAMRVNVEALRERADDPCRHQLMESLLHSNQRATRMVKQLLQLMRSEAAPEGTAMQVIRFDSLLQDRLAELDTLAATRGVELELDFASGCSTPLVVRAEPEGMASLVDNLVENAIKYSPGGATVSVRVSRHGGAILLEVSDAGPGIAPALREKVFDRFYRIAGQAQTGSGLGLAIVRNVVARHAGTIRLADSPAGGLLCRVTLQAADFA